MRKHLYKAKRLDNGEWVEGDYGHFHHINNVWSHEIHVTNPQGSEGYWNEVDPSTVCEFTGLTDKNGREIFEGDILGGQCELVDLRGNPTGHYAESRHVVEWSSDDAGFITRKTYESRNPEFYSERRPRGTLKICAKYYPVIGNVHDTPNRGPHDV